MRLVAFGDSITAGQYCDVAWPQFLEGFDVIAKGVSGETTRQMLERFPADVQQQQADIVVIQAGHNDCNRWESDGGLPRVSMAAYYANLLEMVERCRRFGAEPFLCTIVPTAKEQEYDFDAMAYSYSVWDVAHEENAPVIDVRTVFSSHDDWHSLLLEDGLHLSEAGHRVYAETVQAAVRIPVPV